jgi:peptide deformylase
MPIRPIIYASDALIREHSRHVREITPDVQSLIDDMIDTMREANGIGLAAIQVGEPQRIVVVEVPEEPEEPDEGTQEPETTETRTRDEEPRPVQFFVVINPKIARTSRRKEAGIEGCLSVPGLIGEVSRHHAVTIKGQDRDGRPIRIKAEGLLARVFQHEIDHCSGRLFIDLIDDPEKIWAVEEGEEETAEARQEQPEG